MQDKIILSESAKKDRLIEINIIYLLVLKIKAIITIIYVFNYFTEAGVT
jgi:hypothetical protein